MVAEALPTTMHAWQGSAGGKKPIRVEIPVPKLEPDGVLVRVLASGVCHSDCFILGLPGSLPGWKEKFVMGHEGSGVIVKLGAEVPTSFHVGQRVAILCTPGCNKPSCGECGRGYQRLCGLGQNPGLGSDGVFAQYVALKPWGIVPLPEGVSSEVGAVSADAVTTAYHAVKNAAEVQSNQTIVIFGLGGVGFNALQIAIHFKAKRIIVVDTRQEVLDEAVKLGVAKEDALNATAGQKLEEYAAKDKIIIDTTIDFVGNEQTFLSAQLALRPAGRLVLVGLFVQQLPLITLAVVMKDIRIQCSYNGTRQELIECLDLIAKGVISPRVEVGSIKDLPHVLEDLEAGKIKSRMVLLPNY